MKKTKSSRIPITVFVLTLFFWCWFPFLWLLMTSLKTERASLNDPNLFQGPFSIDNYGLVLGQGFLYNLRNSLIVASATTLICIVLGVLISYALVRLRVPKAGMILSGILALSLFPPVSLVPPLYSVWRELGLLNTYPGLVIPYAAFNLPLVVFLLLTFFRSLPGEMEEAAHIDGASPWQTFTQVSLPLVAPGVAAGAIITFVASWNEYLLASTFAPRSLAAQTVPVAIASFTGTDPYDRPIGTITAACVLVSIPMILMALAFQKRIVAGLTSGSVKG